MTNLHIIIYDADATTRARAVRALNQAGINPEDAWLDPRTPEDANTAQDRPADAQAQARAFEAGARRGLELAVDEAARPGHSLTQLQAALARMLAAPSDYLTEDEFTQPLTRDVAGIAVGVMIALPAGIGAVWFATMGGWWWAAAIASLTFALFGTMGLALSLPKRRRDAKGDPTARRNNSAAFHP